MDKVFNFGAVLCIFAIIFWKKRSKNSSSAESSSFCFDQNLLFHGFNQLTMKAQLSCFLTQYSHIFEKLMSQYCLILFKILLKAYFYVKKVIHPLGQILTFFVLTKTLSFTASTSLQGKLNFLASLHNFLTLNNIGRQQFFQNVRKLCEEARKLSFRCKLVEAVKNKVLIQTKNVRI